ncbi:hypothetical protein HA402_004654 [Bradysia odoriphaga]|nr:hypothetical protein HA402_004654 [Bradysia odoriphaga]
MALDKYKCEYCRHIEENVFKCTDNHLICEKCAIEFKKLCKCKKLILNNQQTNPINLLVKYATKPCPYHAFGCTLQITSDELANHKTECEFRPYKCLGELFGLWTCDWTGRQIDLALHLNTIHGESLGANFQYFQKSSVVFNPAESWQTVNIVNGHGKHFVYYMYSDSTKKVINFLIYLLGTKKDAGIFLIDFEIISKLCKFQKIKFVSNCYSDCENIQKIIESEQCAVLTHNTLKNFVWNGELHFKFKIKRKDDDEFTNKKLDDNSKNVTPPTKPVANVPIKNKGTIKANTVKKTNTVPSIIQPVLKSFDIDSPVQTNQITAATPPAASQRTSINAGPDKASKSPCSSPSINKDDDKEARRSDMLVRSLSETPGMPSLPPVQPYKNIDDKLYRRKYPEHCLTKPAFKK